MAITAYTGLPGSGKSYSVVEQVILPALSAGHQVVTNIPLHLAQMPPEHSALVTQFDMQEVIDTPDWFQDVFPKGATLVIDEVWRLWPAGLTANRVATQHKSFLAEHRHIVSDTGRSTEICLVTQDLGQVSAFARNLVNNTYRTVKLDAVGADKRFRVDIYQGAVTGPAPPEKARIRQTFGSYKPDIYKYYKSQTLSDAVSHGSEARTDQRGNLLKSPFFKVLLPVALVLGVVIIFYGFKAVNRMYHPKESKQAAPGETQMVAQGGAPGPAAQIPTPPPSQFYEGMRAYIASNMGRFPWIDFHIAFENERSHVVLDGEQLASLGYSMVAVSDCFVKIKGHQATLNVFCEPEKYQEEANGPSERVDTAVGF